MARPKKQGLDYFPMDVDFDADPKLAMVIGEFGGKCEILIIKLLAYLYKNNGYYFPWSEGEQLMFAKRVSYIGGSSVNFNNEVVLGLVRWGFFDEVMFNSFRVLTSIDIQETWLNATRKRVSKDPKEMPYWIGNRAAPVTILPPQTPLPAEETSYRLLFAEETQFPAEVIPQSKVKESKEEIKKEEPSQEATYWQRERTLFTTNRLFSERFCIARRVEPAALAALMEYFLSTLELQNDIKPAADIQRHFTNWFNKCQREGIIDQEGKHKNAPQPQQSQTVRNVIEQKTDAILDEFN